jgi:hypothetical protein
MKRIEVTLLVYVISSNSKTVVIHRMRVFSMSNDEFAFFCEIRDLPVPVVFVFYV